MEVAALACHLLGFSVVLRSLLDEVLEAVEMAAPRRKLKSRVQLPLTILTIVRAPGVGDQPLHCLDLAAPCRKTHGQKVKMHVQLLEVLENLNALFALFGGITPEIVVQLRSRLLAIVLGGQVPNSLHSVVVIVSVPVAPLVEVLPLTILVIEPPPVLVAGGFDPLEDLFQKEKAADGRQSMREEMGR